MKPEDRKLIVRDQINQFVDCYFPTWRQSQILTAEKVYLERYSFFDSIAVQVKRADDNTGQATIAQELSNGLHFDALSNAVQYIEDLFALLCAAKNPDYFIKNIITYSAGKVEAAIVKKYTTREIVRLFYFPYYNEVDESTETGKAYSSGLARLSAYFEDVQKYYTDHNFFYKQYKHGLTVALKPYRLYTEEQIANDKNGTQRPYLAAFDNVATQKIKNAENVRHKNMALYPAFTEPIRKNLTHLVNEDNVSRYVTPHTALDFESIKAIAAKTRACIETILGNLICFINSESRNLRLPAEDVTKSIFFRFDEEAFKHI